MAPASSTALSLSPPPSLDYSLAARRRSLSTSGSYRTSLGGKPIGPKYHGVHHHHHHHHGSGSRRTSGILHSPVISSTDGNQDQSGADSSRISLSSNGSDSASNTPGHAELGHLHATRMGAFSHTRDEIRDSQSHLVRVSRSVSLILN